MKARTRKPIANQVFVDLPGLRGTQHIRCVSGPFFASSRVPVRLDGNLRGIDRESTPPPTYFPLRVF